MKKWFYNRLSKYGPVTFLGDRVIFYGGWMNVKVPFRWITIKWLRYAQSRFSVVISPDGTPMHPKAMVLWGKP